MTHPAITTQGSTFVQGHGTSTETLVRQTAVPLLRRRVLKGTPEEMARTVNLELDDLHKATLSARSLPFGGPVITIEAVSFTNGASITLSHRLMTDRFTVELVDKSHPSAGTASAGWTQKTATTVTLTAEGTFTADVRFTVKP